MKKMIGFGLAALSAVLILSGCNNTILANNESDDEIVVEKDRAKELEVVLNFGAGKMDVAGGADEWINGNAIYEPKKMKPEVSYDLSGKVGKVDISQPDHFKLGKMKNEWDLKISEDVPVDLVVNAGASDTDLDLKGIQLSNLEVNAGVGEITVDLGGEWKESFDARISSGVGKMTVILPKDTGVRVHAQKGIGSSSFENLISKGDGVYVNEAYEDAKVKIDLDADLGVGEVTFKTEK
ncbi:toast rack family protein [Mesobacillus jeotgali]|uniref:toast rack family protein n=1 Tax=Mesobacillus jeotgali TaxID=129985 RepID=UPI001F2ED65C|nr:toast rack family protein [Mesobacillus jeotgali]